MLDGLFSVESKDRIRLFFEEKKTNKLFLLILSQSNIKDKFS
jgi:hypothetical protein